VTPDEQLNVAFRWSVAGLEKLFVETPRLDARSWPASGSAARDGTEATPTVEDLDTPGISVVTGVWTSLAALAAGEYEKVRAVLEFLGRHQDVDGKILHEMTTSGYAHFDAADPLRCISSSMGRYVRISGDRQFAAQEFSKVLKAIGYCFSTDTDRDHLIENTNVGHGWVEGGQLFPSIRSTISLRAGQRRWKNAPS